MSQAPVANLEASQRKKRGRRAQPDPVWREIAEACLEELVRLHPLSHTPTLEWRSLRVTAGRADYEHGRIDLSIELLIDRERLVGTIKHEYAHLLAFDRHGKKGRGHGIAWRQAMADLGEPAEVRHRYPCQRNTSRQRVVYECARCTARFERRRRLPRKGRYVHARCGGALRFVAAYEVELS